MPDAKRSGKWSPGVLIYPVLLVAIGLLVYRCQTEQHAVRAAGHAYLRAVREHRLDDAYAMLARQTRQRLGRKDFETSLDTPRLEQATGGGFSRSGTSSNGQGCDYGSLKTGDGSTSLRLFMLKEGGAWRVYGIRLGSLRIGQANTDPWSCP